MLNLRGITAVLTAIALLFCIGTANAEELHKNFSHSLSIGNPAQSFEHRIQLPENLAAEGKFFVGRTLALDGKLVIEREELTKTWYYVKVRLPKATLWFAKGSIDITLKAENAPVSPAPEAPTNLRAQGGYHPYFSWAGNGSYSAISLLDRNSGKTLWERVILSDHKCELDEGAVRIGGKYTWAVKQADVSGRYSEEAQKYFRVEARQERCLQCFGHGYVTCRDCHGSGHIVVNGPNNTPTTQICRQCNGTGRQRCIHCNGMGYNVVPQIVESENATRELFDGRISAIDLSVEHHSDKNLQGIITVKQQNGNQQSFLVSEYTLILVIDLDGHARVAQLHQLKPDWKCSLAFDVPDDYENSDFALTDEETGLKYADNMMVYYQP